MALDTANVKIEQQGAGWVVRLGAQQFHCANEQMARQMARLFARPRR
jgi:hypothetical protein